MNYNLVSMVLVTGAASGVSLIENEILKYGSASVIILILLWYSIKSYNADVRREKQLIEEKKDIWNKYHELSNKLIEYLKEKK